MMSQKEESHQTISFPTNRQHVLETLQTWARKHAIHGLLEVDVTKARRFIQEHSAMTGENLSFTGFIISCVGRAVEENKIVHALHNWRNELVLFDDVDLATVVEVTQGDQKFPVAHIIRSVNRKTFKGIHEEIREVQIKAGERMSRPRKKSARLFWMIPAFMRRLFYRIAGMSPVWMKKNVGTVALTAIGMFGKGGGWGIPIAITPLFITIGGIAEKPGVAHGQIEIREYLSLTLTFDHDIVDGAPAARFTSRLKELIESGPNPFDLEGAQEKI
jgi:pyruvate/2-oxoglutarate dehydrogenase complex dihydrolipoamide acyltransferase (E2) component